PTIVLASAAAVRGWPVPSLAIGLSALASALAALAGPRLAVWYRRAPVASRLVVLFMAFLVPTLLVYPSVQFFRDRAMRHLIETQYAVQAMQHPQTLQDSLHKALAEIDALPNLKELADDLAALAASTPGPRSDAAFRVWSQTVLARERLTSDIEMYEGNGKTLVSRFAL